MPEPLPKFRIGSIDFSAATFSEATQAIADRVGNTQEKGTSIHFANAYNIALAENDHSYQNTMNAGDLVFTDGVPVVWAARKLHPNHDWERVYGPDVTTWILENQELGKNSKTLFPRSNAGHHGQTHYPNHKEIPSSTNSRPRLTTIS